METGGVVLTPSTQPGQIPVGMLAHVSSMVAAKLAGTAKQVLNAFGIGLREAVTKGFTEAGQQIDRGFRDALRSPQAT